MTSIVQHPEPHSFSRTPPFNARRYDADFRRTPTSTSHGSPPRFGQSASVPVTRAVTPLGATHTAYLSTQVSPTERRMPYSGKGHTLGPTFSEEEDGDDTEWIASKLQSLGLNHPIKENIQPHLLDTRAGDLGPLVGPDPADVLLQHQLEMQNLAMLRAQNEDHQRRIARAIRATEHMGHATRDHYAALYELQDRHAMVDSAILSLGERIMQLKSQRAYATQQYQHTQSQAYGYMQAQADQRAALSAQMQANIQARTARAQQEEDQAEIRARFERAPNMVSPPSVSVQSYEPRRSPPGDKWTSSAPTYTSPSPFESTGSSPFANRFTSTQGTSLSTFLSRRQPAETESSTDGYFTRASSSAQTSPVSPSVKQDKANNQAAVGYGRPQNLAPPNRVWSAPSQPVTQLQVNPAPRAVSYSEAILRASPIRQPLGPPGEPQELGERNFAVRLRKQAGLNLGMLNRRADPPSPVRA